MLIVSYTGTQNGYIPIGDCCRERTKGLQMLSSLCKEASALHGPLRIGVDSILSFFKALIQEHPGFPASRTHCQDVRVREAFRPHFAVHWW